MSLQPAMPAAYGRPQELAWNDAHRVEELRAVRVDRALGVAGGPGRVAGGRRRPLVECGPAELGRLAGHQRLVVQQLAQLVLRDRAAVVEDDDLAHRGDLARDLVEQRDQRPVHEEHAVVSVPDRELQLVGEEAQVQRVEDRPHAGDRVVELEVSVVVPGERRNPVARLHPEAAEHVGDLADPRREVAVGVSVEPVLPLGDDLLLGEQPLASPEHVLDGERVVLHQPSHTLLTSAANDGPFR